MVRFEIPKVTVLVLLSFVCQSAHSLETGCQYPSNVSVENSVLHHDLKCTYLYGGLTHMLVTKHLIDPPIFWPISTAIGKILPYNHTVKCQILSLYRLNVMRMDALWALHLYLSMLNSFYETSVNKLEDGRKIITTHCFIIARLYEDLTDCRKDNSFNNHRKIISNEISTEDELRLLMVTNAKNANALLTNNNICDQTYYDYYRNALQVGILFLNNMGSKDAFVEDLMNVFNVQVEWSGTGERLKDSWQQAHILNWPVNFESIKLYFKLTFNFLKIVMLRLTLKHLYYLEPSFGTEFYVYYAREWYYKVQQFGKMLSLSEDLHVKNLLISLDNLVKQEEKIDSVAHYLIVILNELCLPLGCDATKPFELNEQEFKTPYKSSIGKDYVFMKKSPIPIAHYSLSNTRAFLHYLRWAFKFVDFNLVRSLIEYVNEVIP